MGPGVSAPVPGLTLQVLRVRYLLHLIPSCNLLTHPLRVLKLGRETPSSADSLLFAGPCPPEVLRSHEGLAELFMTPIGETDVCVRSFTRVM